MERYNRFFTWYRAVLTGVVSIGGTALRQYLIAIKLPLPETARLILIIAIAVVFVETMEWLALILFKNCRWFRKKILGRAYFEGYGIDVTFDPEKKLVLYGALGRFSFSNNQLMADAKVFDLNGESIGEFEIRTFDYTEKGLKYGFEGLLHVGSSQKGKYYGYGEMNFGPRDGAPKNYYGFFIDNCDFKQLYFQGEMIDVDTIKLIERSQVDQRTFLIKYLADFAKRKKFKLSDSLNESN